MIELAVFHQKADRTLENLIDFFENHFSKVEVDLLDGTLMVEFSDIGNYVINKHSPSRQIWLASPLSGAHHFLYDENKSQWINTRNNKTIVDILSTELNIHVT